MPRKKPSAARFMLRLFNIDSGTLRGIIIAIAAFVLAMSLYVFSGPLLWATVVGCLLLIAGTALHLKLHPPKRRKPLLGISIGGGSGAEWTSSTSREPSLPPDPPILGQATNLRDHV